MAIMLWWPAAVSAASIVFQGRAREPSLPAPVNVVDHGAPCGSPASPGPPARARGAAHRPKPHDMTALRTSGYLERLGFHHRPATHESTWREPHKMRKAIEASR